MFTSFAYAGTGRRLAFNSVQEMDSALVWLIMGYIEAFTHKHARVATSKTRKEAEVLTLQKSMLDSMLPRVELSKVPDFGNRQLTHEVFFELAALYENGQLHLHSYNGSTQISLWRRLIGYSAKLPGFKIPLGMLQFFGEGLSRTGSSIYDLNSAESFCKRMEPMIGSMRSYNSPGSLAGANAVDFIASWSAKDKALILIP